MWLMKGHNIAASVVVVDVAGIDLFHGANIQDGVYKVEVREVMLPNTPLFFPNHNDEHAQLLLNHVKVQFTLWEGVHMWKAY
jgi:hypothetical protein